MAKPKNGKKTLDSCVIKGTRKIVKGRVAPEGPLYSLLSFNLSSDIECFQQLEIHCWQAYKVADFPSLKFLDMNRGYLCY